jgi:acetyl-CoA acetyltransferase
VRALNAAILGAAITPVGVWPQETSFGLAARALAAALDDAGLERAQLDGFVWNLGRPSGEDYDAVVDALGLRVRFVNQFWTHGRFTGSSLIVAAMAVTAGLADFVACVGGIKRHSSTAPPPPSFGPLPDDLRNYGVTSFVHYAALALQSYLALYAVDRDQLGEVVLASRAWAGLNDTAYLREPLTQQSYEAAPYVAEPLRDVDCFPFGPSGSPMNDYGACVIIGRGDAAASSPARPVYILGAQGVQASREEAYFGRPGLGLFGQTTSTFEPSEWDMKIYADARTAPHEINAFYTYDAFSPLVWMALERFGHCRPGEAASWVTQDRIGPHGSFPVNTNGGLISQGHTAGWGHIVELTRQLRGDAGPRQLDRASVAQWATVFGDSLILTNDEHRWRQ